MPQNKKKVWLQTFLLFNLLMMYTYCIWTMSWNNYVFNSDNIIDRNKATQQEFVNIGILDLMVNKKSISFIKLIKTYSELIELGQNKINPIEYPHLRAWNKPLNYNQPILWQF